MPASNREMLDTGSDKRYSSRDSRGRFTADQVDVGRSSAADRRQDSDTPDRHGHGDRGDKPTKS